MWFVLEANYNALVPLDTDASVNLDLNVLTRLQIRKAMVLLENDLFLSKLTLMFDKSRSKGHVRWWKKEFHDSEDVDLIPYFLLSICMKRYDGRTKPIPKPRPAKKKGVSILSCSNVSNPYLPSNFASHLDTGEAAEPQDPTCLSPTPRTLRVHVPCQVLWNSLALKLNVCFRAVFKNEKISTVIHSKEVRNFA